MVEAMIGAKECLREVDWVGDRAHALPCSLARNQIGDAGATALAEGVKHCVSLTSLWCVCNAAAATERLRGACVRRFRTRGRTLPHSTSRVIRSLRDNRIGDAGAASLGECLKTNTSLTTLMCVW